VAADSGFNSDSRWLQLEVCREFQRQRCTRNDNDCKFAHPGSNVEIIDGKVIACYDSIKERCSRETCKYFHAPAHLRDQLIINGRNHLALKNAMLQQIHHLPLAPSNPAYLANLPTTVAITNPSVQTSPSLNAQQIITQQQLALLAACSAYGQQAALAVQDLPSLPSLTDLQAYNLITTLPPSQQSGNHATTNLLTNQIHNNTNNHLVNHTAALMRNYISPITTGNTNAQTIKQHQNANSVATRQIIKLEVCREYQRCACKRSESECRYAHPASYVNTTQDGSQVVICSNFLKRGCNREQCRFFHPPSNLMDQVKQQQQQLQQNQLNQLNQQFLAQQQRAAMMLANQSLSTQSNTNQSLLRKKRPRESDNILLGFPRVVPLNKRPALDKMLLPGSTYEHALLQPSFVPFTLPGHTIHRY